MGREDIVQPRYGRGKPVNGEKSSIGTGFRQTLPNFASPLFFLFASVTDQKEASTRHRRDSPVSTHVPPFS